MSPSARDGTVKDSSAPQVWEGGGLICLAQCLAKSAPAEVSLSLFSLHSWNQTQSWPQEPRAYTGCLASQGTMLHAVRLQVWNKELASGDMFLRLGFPSSCFGKHGIISYPEGFFFFGAVWFPFNKHELEDTHGLTDFLYTAHLHGNPLSSRLSPTTTTHTLQWRKLTLGKVRRPPQGHEQKQTYSEQGQPGSNHAFNSSSVLPGGKTVEDIKCGLCKPRPTALAAQSPLFSFSLSC